MIWGRCGCGLGWTDLWKLFPELMANLQLGDPGFKIWLIFDGGKKRGCLLKYLLQNVYKKLFQVSSFLLWWLNSKPFTHLVYPLRNAVIGLLKLGIGVDSTSGWISSQVHIGFIYQWHLFECCASSKDRQSGVVSWRWFILSWTGQAT